MYSIVFLCEELLKFLQACGFMESTINQYKKEFKVFQKFCSERNVFYYSFEIGSEYANDVISPKTGKFSYRRYEVRDRIVRYFNHYVTFQKYEIIHKPRIKFDDQPLGYMDDDYRIFKSFIVNKYDNLNTIKFYTYEVFIFIRFLVSIDIKNLDTVKPCDVHNYLKTVQPNRQKAALCALKFYFNHLERTDLINSIAGMHAVKTKKLIPYLTKEESNKIWKVLNGDNISYKEKSLFLLGFVLGIRACDIVNLKLSDIHWEQDYISFTQQKTGNAVNLPLVPVLGNALFNYITQERKKSSYDNVFISNYPPFKPFRDHSSCYFIVRKIIDLSGIDLSDRFCGIHFLRHNVASNMVNNEIQLEVIASILGHASPNTTGIYITVDEAKLRDCVLSFSNLNKGEIYE